VADKIIVCIIIVYASIFISFQTNNIYTQQPNNEKKYIIKIYFFIDVYAILEDFYPIE
jgi:hypothetical protein